MFNFLAAKPEQSGDFATLDLQLFSEDEAAVETVEETTEEPAVEAETQETTEEEVAPEPTAVAEDVTTTQAFSRRLKEETSKATQAGRDATYSEQYGESHGIHTEAEYKQALATQRDQEMRESLKDKGYPDEEATQIVEDRKFRQEHEVTLNTQANSQRDYAEYLDLTADYTDIKDPSQIPAEVWQLKADKNISLLDAQNRIAVRDFKAQLAKTKLDTEQETIKKISKNAATSPGSASDGNVSHQSKSVSDMSAAEFESYREEVSNR